MATNTEILINAVRRMRDAQNEYSRSESPVKYAEKLDAERHVDELLDAIDAVEYERRNPRLDVFLP